MRWRSWGSELVRPEDESAGHAVAGCRARRHPKRRLTLPLKRCPTLPLKCARRSRCARRRARRAPRAEERVACTPWQGLSDELNRKGVTSETDAARALHDNVQARLAPRRSRAGDRPSSASAAPRRRCGRSARGRLGFAVQAQGSAQAAPRGAGGSSAGDTAQATPPRGGTAAAPPT